MSDVKTIVETIGRQRIAEEVGVTPQAVGNAVAAEEFPAWWYEVVSRLCAEAEIDCPFSAFAMRRKGSSVARAAS